MADLAHSPTLSAQPLAEAGPRLAEGATVGEYVVERFLGAGAMGEVYAGKHPLIGKRVAIKVLRRELAASKEVANRLIREAQAVNQVDHPNVVDVFALGRLDDGRLYLVMDLVDGKSLRAIVNEGPLELAAALDILAPIADALDAAHKRGVVHRDLKPDNIVVTDSHKVFVLDFGLAKLVSKVNEGVIAPGTLTGEGMWMGTPGYMAPEQWSADGAGPASDRYALGVVAYELLAGKLPFAATSVPQMMEQHFRASVPALSASGVTGIPARVDSVLRRALAKDPEARFPTAHDMIDALRAAAGTSRGARGAVASPEHRKLLVPALAGAGVLALAIVAYFVVRAPDRAKEPSAAPHGPPAGTVRVDVTSRPDEAELLRDGKLVGRTPAQLYLEPGASANVVVRKPGFLPATKTIVAKQADSVELVTLAEVTQFQGTWRLPDGSLRAFKRNGDLVEVSKLEAIGGRQQLYRKYQLVAADTGIAFATDEEVVDQRAPDRPSCHTLVHVRYEYDPSADALAVQRDKYAVDFAGGECTAHANGTETLALVRVDNTLHEPTEITAPVGQVDGTKKPSRNVIPLDPQAEVQKKLDAELAKQQKLAKQPPKLKAPPPDSKSNLFRGGDSQQVQNANEPAQLPNQDLGAQKTKD